MDAEALAARIAALEAIVAEERHQREEAQKREEEERRQKEEALKREEEERRQKEEERRQKVEAQQQSRLAQKREEEERQQKNAAEGRAISAEEKEALARLLTQDAELRALEAAQQLHNATRIRAREALLMPLPEYSQRTITIVQSNTKPRDTAHPAAFAKWHSFVPSMESLLARVSEPPVDVTKCTDVFLPENPVMDYEVSVHRFVESTLSHLTGILREALNLQGFHLDIGPSTAELAGGLPDIAVKYQGRLVFVIELKRPRVRFRDATHPADDPNLSGNLFNTAMQTYHYMVTKGNLAFGLFTNYDQWVFLKRTIVNHQQVLEMSEVFKKDRARLAFGAFIMNVIETPAEQHELGAIGAPGVVDVVDDVDNPGELGPENQEGVVASGATTTTTALTGGGAPRRVQPSTFFDVGTVVAGFAFTTTKQALGIKTLSLHARADSTLLGTSEKGCVFRYQTQGRDLAWRQLDVYGLPRHSPDFSLDTLQSTTTREIETYMHLRESWGVLVPHFVYFGRDFAMLWVFVTSYEGVDLRRLYKENGGLTQTIKTKARESLIQLHCKEVIHGDVALRNVVWRENDGNILWIDFEQAEIGGENFAQRAEVELQAFEAELNGVPTLPETEIPSTPPLSLPPTPKRAKIYCVPLSL